MYKIINQERILITQEIAPFPFPSNIATVQETVVQESTPGTTAARAPAIEIPNLLATDGFVEKKFRVISKSIFFLDVDQTAPVDYTKEKVLEESLNIMPPLLGLFKDHIPSMNYLVGQAVNHAYNRETSPEGIDSLFRVDSQTDPNLARHVQTGSANRASLTLLATFSKSHDMKWKEFLENLGQMVDGSLVRFIAEQIKRYYEVSLVWTGADPTAMAHKLEYFANLKDPKSFYINQQTEKEVKQMDPEIQKLLDTIKQKYGVECATINQALKFLEGKDAEILTLKQQITGLENQVNELKPFKETATQMLTTLREDVIRLQKLTAGGTIDTLTESVIQAAQFDKLKEMQTSLAAKAEKTVSLKCENCGSTNVTRLSSIDVPPTQNGEKKTTLKPIKFGFGGSKK